MRDINKFIDDHDWYLDAYWGIGFGYCNQGNAKMIIFLCFMLAWIRKEPLK